MLTKWHKRFYEEQDIHCPDCQSLNIIMWDMFLFGWCRCSDCGFEFVVKQSVIIEEMEKRP